MASNAISSIIIIMGSSLGEAGLGDVLERALKSLDSPERPRNLKLTVFLISKLDPYTLVQRMGGHEKKYAMRSMAALANHPLCDFRRIEGDVGEVAQLLVRTIEGASPGASTDIEVLEHAPLRAIGLAAASGQTRDGARTLVWQYCSSLTQADQDARKNRDNVTREGVSLTSSAEGELAPALSTSANPILARCAGSLGPGAFNAANPLTIADNSTLLKDGAAAHESESVDAKSVGSAEGWLPLIHPLQMPHYRELAYIIPNS